MNDERFFDLAMKVIARHATGAEHAELEELLARHPELKTEFERLQADGRLAREVTSLHAAVEATQPEFPAYARERLEGQVRKTLGRSQPPSESRSERNVMWVLRRVLGVATVTAAIVVAFLILTPAQPVIEVAMLDTGDDIRGANTNQIAAMRQRWPNVRVFSNAAELEVWTRKQPQGSANFGKIIYDPAAAEVRIVGRVGNSTFSRTNAVETNPARALEDAARFLRGQFAR